LGTNLPPDEVLLDGLGDGDAAEAAIVVAYSAAPPIPPMSIEPATAPATTNLRTPLTMLASLFRSLNTSVET